MRKYVLPVVVCVAVGALIVILVQMGDDRPTRPLDKTLVAGTGGTDEPARGPRIGEPAKTRTGIDEHRDLRELERAIARPDMKHARVYQQRVCEDIERIQNDPKLTSDLLALIREYGVGSDDLRRRDVMLQILRVFRNPEATAMIADEFYRARTPEERMLLLEAMSHKYHDPKRAAIWATDIALNDENEEYRHRAFEVLDRFSEDDVAVVETGKKVYFATTSDKQKFQALAAINRRVLDCEEAKAFIRERFMNPREDELGAVIEGIPEWGTEADVAYLERLQEEFPALKDALKEQARMLRKRLSGDTEPDLPEDEEEPPMPPKQPETPPKEPEDDGG